MSNKPFSELEHTPRSHFKLCFYDAVLNLIERVLRSMGSFEEAFEKFPFLIGYNDELAEYGLSGVSLDEAAQWWGDSVSAWEDDVNQWLPIASLRRNLSLDRRALD